MHSITRSPGNFNPRSPCGERREDVDNCPTNTKISIHAPRAGSDPAIGRPQRREESFQSTLPVRGATHLHSHDAVRQPISIHAPRAGSDVILCCSRLVSTDFNPRSPCGERQSGRFCIETTGRFQSTLPVRGATKCCVILVVALQISIHAPRAGSDAQFQQFMQQMQGFQSTLPVRGATGVVGF